MDDIFPPPPAPPRPPAAPQPNNNKPDRKTVEKNRRDQMKLLYSSLCSLVMSASPSSASAPFSGQQLPDRIDEATNYIKKAQERIERLKEKKRQLMITAGNSSSGGASATKTNKRSRSPQIEVRDLGSGLNAVLIICSDDDRSIMHKSISAIEEGGAEVLNAHYTSFGDKSILSLHTLAGDNKESGSVTGSILDRLKSVFSIRNSNT